MKALENLLPKPLDFEFEPERRYFFETALNGKLRPALILADKFLQNDGDEVQVEEAILHPTAAVWCKLLEDDSPAMELQLQMYGEQHLFVRAAGLNAHTWARCEGSCDADVTVERFTQEILWCVSRVRDKIYDPSWYHPNEKVPIRWRPLKN